MTKTVQVGEGTHMVGSIVVVGVMICCTLLHSLYDLKAVHLNMQHCLILELYESELSHNTSEAIKSIYHTKGEGVVDQSTGNQMVQEILLGLQEPLQG